MTVNIAVKSIKRLLDDAYIVATLKGPDGEQLRSRPSYVDVEFDDDCVVGQKCGRAEATFEKVRPDVVYELVVCHKMVKGPCRRERNGSLKDLGVHEKITPSGRTYTRTVDLKDSY